MRQLAVARPRPLLGLIAAVATASIAALSPVSADAYVCIKDDPQGGQHCWALVDWYPSGYYDGVLGYLYTYNFSTPNPSYDWAANYVLICTSAYLNCQYHIQEGWWVGFRNDGSGATGIVWFYEWQNQCMGNYQRNYLPQSSYPTSLGNEYATKISYSGSYRWALYRNGTSFFTTQSGCADTLIDEAQIGAEITNGGAQDGGEANNLEKRGSASKDWTYQLGGSSVGIIPPTGNPFSAGWSNPLQSAWWMAN